MNEGKTISLLTKASQIDVDGNKNNIEYYVEASYIEKGQTKYITYKETEVSGMEGTTTTIRIGADTLSIIRFGSFTSKLEFKQGSRTETNYATPYGQMELVVDTRKLDINIVPGEKSTILLLYILESGNQKVMVNEMTLSFKI